MSSSGILIADYNFVDKGRYLYLRRYIRTFMKIPSYGNRYSYLTSVWVEGNLPIRWMELCGYSRILPFRASTFESTPRVLYHRERSKVSTCTLYTCTRTYFRNYLRRYESTFVPSYFRTFKVLYSTCMCTCSSEDDSVSGFFFKLSWSIKLATVLSERTHRTRKRARQLSK